jgi:PQQ-dependent dehydrogenase (methanol/ethanol family)
MKRRLVRVAPAVASLWVVMAGGCGKGREERAPERPAATQVREAKPTFTVVDDRLLGLPAAEANWAIHGGDYGNRRYSSLSQVTTSNVSNLVPVWIHRTGIAESFVTTPIVVDGAMYLSTPESRVVALNAATGERLWEYVPELAATLLCCGPDNQGVAVYQDKVIVARVDGRVVALNHRTGAPVWETAIADPREGYSQTVAPLAAGGRVFVGVGGSEYGARGFVVALDATSGKELWRWYTIEPTGNSPNAWQGTWKETDPFGTPLGRDIANEQRLLERYQEGWKRGGGSVRTTPAYDPATGFLYISVGGPSPSLDGVIRPGDNRNTGSLVALEAATGKPRWTFQYIPHDVWDLSGGSPPFLFEAGGRKLVGMAGKTGWVYVVDAATGRPVIRSDNFVPQENLFAQPGDEGIRILPGANGGNPGAPGAYSPQTGWIYVPALHQPMVYSRSYQPWEKGRLWVGGSFRLIPGERQWGILSAINPVNGQIQWQRQVPMPMSGGALATAGGLVFVGQGTGTLDAFNARTGELVWQFATGAGISGSPVTYQIDGVQYIAIASGGHYQLDTPRGDAVVVFTLFENRPARPLATYPVPNYPRGGPAVYGAARQVPAAQLGAARPDSGRKTVPGQGNLP